MREIIYTTAFKKDIKKLRGSGLVDMELLKTVVTMLANDIPLPRRHRDHALTGNWVGYRECHLKPDWLLVYKLEPGEIYLARTASHAKLF